jgi:signal transduction histidine kinase
LIGNAIKFTFQGAITIRVSFKNKELITKVEDTGIGILEQDLQKLFHFFGQVSK